MISIASAMQQEAIKQVLVDYQAEDVQFVFKEKQGIKLLFDVTGDQETAAKKAKELIKAQPWGSVLNVQVVVV